MQFNLPIVPVVDPGDSAGVKRDEVLAGQAVYAGEGIAINSSSYNGTPTAEFKQQIIADLATKGQGREAVNYKLRDWLFSRQHFWGEPFPVLHELNAQGERTGLMRTVPANELPVNLPELKIFDSHGSPSRRWIRHHRIGFTSRSTANATSTNQYHAAVGRVVLVLLAIPRSEERTGPDRSGD